MPEVVADLLQGQALAHETGGAGVPKCMSAKMTWIRDPQPTQSLVDDVIDAVGVDGTPGTQQGQEYLPMRRRRTGRLQVTEDRRRDGRHQRIRVAAPALCSRDRQALPLPVNIIKTKPGDLTRPKAVHREESKNGRVAYVARARSAGTSQQTLDVGPRRPDRQLFLAMDVGLDKCIRNAHRPPAVLVAIPKEWSKLLHSGCDGHPAPTSASAGKADDERIDICSSERLQRPSRRGEMVEERGRVALATLNGDRCEAALVAHMSDIRIELGGEHSVWRWRHVKTAEETAPTTRQDPECPSRSSRRRLPAAAPGPTAPAKRRAPHLAKRDAVASLDVEVSRDGE